METGIGPEERGEQESQFVRFEVQLLAQRHAGDGKDAAVDVIYGHRENQEDQDQPFQACNHSEGRGGADGHPMSLTLVRSCRS